MVLATYSAQTALLEAGGMLPSPSGLSSSWTLLEYLPSICSASPKDQQPSILSSFWEGLLVVVFEAHALGA